MQFGKRINRGKGKKILKKEIIKSLQECVKLPLKKKRMCQTKQNSTSLISGRLEVEEVTREFAQGNSASNWKILMGVSNSLQDRLCIMFSTHIPFMV